MSVREVEYHIALLSEFTNVMKENRSKLAATYNEKLELLYDIYAKKAKG
jgi:hypothetical protein